MKMQFDFSDVEKELKRKIDSLSGKVELHKLLTDKFMCENTQYENMDDFFSACNIESSEDFLSLPEEDLDVFISENSKFNSWEEMKTAAATEYFAENWDNA